MHDSTAKLRSPHSIAPCFGYLYNCACVCIDFTLQLNGPYSPFTSLQLVTYNRPRQLAFDRSRNLLYVIDDTHRSVQTYATCTLADLYVLCTDQSQQVLAGMVPAAKDVSAMLGCRIYRVNVTGMNSTQTVVSPDPSRHRCLRIIIKPTPCIEYSLASLYDKLTQASTPAVSSCTCICCTCSLRVRV